MLTQLFSDWSGQTDGSGNATIKLVPDRSRYSEFNVAGQVAGNPAWLIYRGGSFIWPGTGTAVGLGPFVFSPGEELKIVVQNAQPNMPVTGTIRGLLTDDNSGAELPHHQSLSVATLPTVQKQTTGAPLTGMVKKPYDWYVRVVSAAGGVADAVSQVAAISNLTVVLDSWRASLFQTGGSAGAANLILRDTTGGQIERFKHPMAVAAAANSVDRMGETDVGHQSGPGGNQFGLEMTFDSGIGGVSQYISMAGYYE